MAVTAFVQDGAQTNTGPIARAAARQAARLAAASGQQPPDPGWSRVRRITAGTEILLSTSDTTRAPRTFISADDSQIVVLDLTGPFVTRHLRQVLLAVASFRPQVFDADRIVAGFVADDVRIAAGGVFVVNQRVADVDRVVSRTVRQAVEDIRTPPTVRASLGWTVAGAGIGLLVGSTVATSDCFRPGRCTVQNLASVLGPVAGGSLAYYATRRKSEDLIYRRP